jgi:hypothetical protein
MRIHGTKKKIKNGILNGETLEFHGINGVVEALP